MKIINLIHDRINLIPCFNKPNMQLQMAYSECLMDQLQKKKIIIHKNMTLWALYRASTSTKAPRFLFSFFFCKAVRI